MSRISVFGIGQAAKSPYVSAKQMVNMYAETRPMGEKSVMVGYRTPGLNLFTEFLGSVVGRGLWSLEKTDVAYTVVGNIFYELNGSATQTQKGLLLTSTGRVSMADNGVQVMIVDGTYGYIYTTTSPVSITSITRSGTTATATTATAHGLGTGMVITISGSSPAQYNGLYGVIVTSPTTFQFVMASDPGSSASPVGSYVINLAFCQIADPDFPANPMTVTFLAGRFVINVSLSSRFYCSDMYDGLSWDGLNYANAETSSDPIVAVWANNGQLIIFGTKSTEFWGNSGSVDFPFSQLQGTANEWGLAAPWSVAKYDNSVAMLVKNRMGQVMLAKMNGYVPGKISNPDVDSIINRFSVTSDASAYSYMLGGHPMYVINFNNAQQSWLYDGSTSIWTKLESFGLTRHRAQYGTSFLNFTLVADYQNGKLYSLTDKVMTDNGQQIESYIVSQTIADQDLDRLEVSKLRVDMEVGKGSTDVPLPQVGLSVSRDNGKTWGNEILRDIGPIGNYSNTVDFTRLGTARNFVFKLRVTDPFDFTLINAIVDPPD